MVKNNKTAVAVAAIAITGSNKFEKKGSFGGIPSVIG
jgi:hypothetical protein